MTLRLIVRASPGGHQTPILTNRADLTAAAIAHRISARWPQEPHFTYAREHFALDALDFYADTIDDPTRLVPNPAKARARARVGWWALGSVSQGLIRHADCPVAVVHAHHDAD